MQGTQAANAIRWTLTGSAAPGQLAASPGTEVVIINEAIASIARRYPWRWLTRTSKPLALIAGQPWVDLPQDFDELQAVIRGPGLLTALEPATEREMMELRAGALTTSDTFGFYYRIEHAHREQYNAVLDSEDLSQASWTATNLTIAAGGLSPQGVSEAQSLVGTTTAGTIAQSLPFSALAEHGRTFILSVFVKAGTSASSEVTLRQTGGAGETTSRSPSTVARIAWTSGVPTATLQSSQGPGSHDVRTSLYADGWYRLELQMTVDLDEALPSSQVQIVIRPAVAAAGASMLAWGVQLEEASGHQIDSSEVRARRYQSSEALPQLALKRQMSIWPTPSTTVPGAFLLSYRAKPPEIADEGDTIPLPWYLEGAIFLDVCRAIARGWHAEDAGTILQRLEPIWSSQDFAAAVERDDDNERNLGPMRGTAVEALARTGRNWGTSTLVPPPGALA